MSKPTIYPGRLADLRNRLEDAENHAEAWGKALGDQPSEKAIDAAEEQLYKAEARAACLRAACLRSELQRLETRMSRGT